MEKIVTHKRCSHCGEVKPVCDFGKQKSGKAGLHSWCKECSCAEAKAWRLRNPEKKKEHDRQYRQRDKGRYKGAVLKKNYGISLEEYNTILNAQDGGCAICGIAVDADKMLAVDHDHGTGQIRGLLCGNCNRAIGQLQDSPHLLRRAALYLEADNDYPIVPKELVLKKLELSKKSREREVKRWKEARKIITRDEAEDRHTPGAFEKIRKITGG